MKYWTRGRKKGWKYRSFAEAIKTAFVYCDSHVKQDSDFHFHSTYIATDLHPIFISLHAIPDENSCTNRTYKLHNSWMDLNWGPVWILN